MTTKIKPGKPATEKALDLRVKLQKRAAASNGHYVALSSRKKDLTRKLERLREESRGSTVQVLAEG